MDKETAMEELGLDCVVRVMAMVELGLELVLDSKAPVMVMVTPQSKLSERISAVFKNARFTNYLCVEYSSCVASNPQLVTSGKTMGQ
ncbi:uncharacterized protein PHALS_11701 [Plasmopara halstedii]|uniref:Uncharacterized protein n=1 Tax=Plasmopara halstedii TaxID=4781 RepID=A0A0P1AJC3_PLAHL|nr:uncharacterized protein PHALS_11701 [Plasmopara halstedii]CEG41350.1 hypothetical protein PHALS_11701 [Plasmopara halstedii]|eukprot:XP_024577719.1 hypothetical protein PHALS_11701 [Plasmopara halstedii]